MEHRRKREPDVLPDKQPDYCCPKCDETVRCVDIELRGQNKVYYYNCRKCEWGVEIENVQSADEVFDALKSHNSSPIEQT